MRRTNPLAALLEAVHDDAMRDDFDDGDNGENILPEAAIERLREAAKRIADGNPFKPGDLVMVRKDAPVMHTGIPRVVVEVRSDAPLYKGDPGVWPFATRADTITISIMEGDIVPTAQPHWMLEPYVERKG